MQQFRLLERLSSRKGMPRRETRKCSISEIADTESERQRFDFVFQEWKVCKKKPKTMPFNGTKELTRSPSVVAAISPAQGVLNVLLTSISVRALSNRFESV